MTIEKPEHKIKLILSYTWFLLVELMFIPARTSVHPKCPGTAERGGGVLSFRNAFMWPHANSHCQ